MIFFPLQGCFCFVHWGRGENTNVLHVLWSRRTASVLVLIIQYLSVAYSCLSCRTVCELEASI